MRYPPVRIGIRAASGMTLIEMMIAILLFSITLAVLYPSFEALSNKMKELNDKQELTQRGQRVLDFMAEEIRLAGLYVGPRPGVTFCADTGVNSLEHQDVDDFYDTLTFLTSEAASTTLHGVPYLMTAAAADATVVSVNAAPGDVSAIKSPPDIGKNARSFITFDTLAPTLLTRMYEVESWPAGSNTITLTSSLLQPITANARVYSVVRKRFDVDTTRNLRLFKWPASCNLATPDIDILIPSSGDNNASGGVDAFQVEYVLNESAVPVQSITAGDIANVRSVIIWLLLRSDFPSKEYKSTVSYTWGRAHQVTKVFNDHYRRVLLSRAVEVKNVGF